MRIVKTSHRTSSRNGSSRGRASSAALPTGRFLAIVVLPINHLLLLVGEKDLLGLFTSQSGPSHVRIREITDLETGAAKVGFLKVRPHEINFAEEQSEYHIPKDRRQ